MEKFVFSDGQDICVYSDGKVEKYPSKFIEHYKNSLQVAEQGKEWKYSGEGARFRGDTSPKQTFESRIEGVNLAAGGEEAVYSFTVNSTSGIYCRKLTEDKSPETHVITSMEYSFAGGSLNSAQGRLATSVRRNAVNADIAVFDLKNGNYITVTDGDTLDIDPFFAPDNANKIYFSSRGAGRDLNGGFVEYSPAAICMLDLEEMEVKEIKSSSAYSYYKPIPHGGKLYAIQAPARDKKPNPVISFLLIPWRILQAIANLITMFIHAFTGKSVTSGGDNPAKGREYDSRKEFIKGNLINVEKEAKRNKGKKDGDYGLMPLSWKLVEVESGKQLASGVADFDIAADGTVIYTNGRRIFAITGGKRQKLCNTGACFNVAFSHSAISSGELFDL